MNIRSDATATAAAAYWKKQWSRKYNFLFLVTLVFFCSIIGYIVVDKYGIINYFDLMDGTSTGAGTKRKKQNESDTDISTSTSKSKSKSTPDKEESLSSSSSKIVLITNNNMDRQQQQNSTDEMSNGIDDKDDMAVRCKAACPEHLKHNNIIILDKKYFRWQGGLNDRIHVLKGIGSIAANLCATVYTPPPYELLSRSHNQGKAISKELRWSHFARLYFDDYDKPAIIDYDGSGTEYLKTIQKNTMGKKWKTIVLSDEANEEEIERDFREAIKIVDNQWNQINENVESLIIKIDKHAYRFVNTMGNTLFGKDCLGSIQERTPLPLENFAKNTMKLIARTHPNTTNFGALHIRRGDAKNECNTTLEEMKSYLGCSLRELSATSKITMFVMSDEEDRDYRNGIQKIIEDLGHTFVDMDETVLHVMRKGATKDKSLEVLLNNFFTFKVEKLIIRNCDFVLEKRREIRCNACDSANIKNMKYKFLKTLESI